MTLKEKLFYKNDKKTGKKRVSKLKTIGLGLLVFIVLFVIILNVLPPSDSMREIHAQKLAYDYLPNGSVDEKVDYVLEKYAKTNEDAITLEEYADWLIDAGVDLNRDADVAAALFKFYDTNSNKLLEKNEIKEFLSIVEKTNKMLEDSKK